MSGEGPVLGQRISSLMMEAAEWRVLSRLFECPADGWDTDIRQLGREVGAEDVRGSAAAALREAPTAGQYYSLFGPGGPAPPREASYRESLELGSLISELAGYYEAFGYTPGDREPPDHVAVETSFVAYLKLKEAYALATGDEDHAALTAATSVRFRADHLASIAAPLARILEAAPFDYLARASRALASRAGKPAPARRLLMAQAPDADDNLFDCGV